MRHLPAENIEYIVVHCTATPEGMDIGFKEIDRMHKNRGFSMCGYHKIVRLNGSVEKGRELNVQGAHVKGYNSKSIGIAYVGGLGTDRKAKDTRTAMQQVAIANELTHLKSLYPKAKVLGHRDLSPDLDGDGVVETHEYMKQCPCFDAMVEYNFLNGNGNDS